MKRIAFFAVLALLAVGCNNSTPATAEVQEAETTVYYFHGKQRCKTCLAIERLTDQVVNQQYADAVADGKLAYRVLDYTLDENTGLADRYEVGWSSLIIDGKEGWENLTDMAFSYAKSDSSEFVKQLSAAIDSKLQQ